MYNTNQLDHFRKICPGCGKICFNKKDAVTKANWLEKQGKDRLRVYPCANTNNWHLTKVDKYKK